MTVSRRTFLLAAGSATLAACTHAAHRAATRRPPVRAPRATTTSPTAPETTTPPPGSAARFIRSGPTSANVVALTFHGSGDIALATELLDAARAGGAALTIFAVGRWLDENPDVARRVLDAGHELANHTYTHPALGQATAVVVTDEIVRCRDALTRHAGSPGAWFRPSGVEAPGAGPFESTIGKSGDPSTRRAPAGPIVTVLMGGKIATAVSALRMEAEISRQAIPSVSAPRPRNPVRVSPRT